MVESLTSQSNNNSCYSRRRRRRGRQLVILIAVDTNCNSNAYVLSVIMNKQEYALIKNVHAVL
jgi:hypothetical protein